jgi:hypothetical protein
LAAFVADIADHREEPYVEHEEVNKYFGWSSGRTATQYASECSERIIDEDGAKAIAENHVEPVIDTIEEKVEGE